MIECWKHRNHALFVRVRIIVHTRTVYSPVIVFGHLKDSDNQVSGVQYPAIYAGREFILHCYRQESNATFNQVIFIKIYNLSFYFSK